MSSEAAAALPELVQERATGFINIDEMMASARAKYAANPDLVPKVELKPSVPTAEDLEFDQRVDIAISSAQRLLAEAKAQLAASCVAPEQLTDEEANDKAEEQRWGAGFRMAEHCNDRWLLHNQRLFAEVIEATSELDDDWVLVLDDIQIPGTPPSPRLKDLERVSAGAATWIAMSKARSKDHMIRDAALKPVLVVKPAHGLVESSSKEAGGVALPGVETDLPRSKRSRRTRTETRSDARQSQKRIWTTAAAEEEKHDGANSVSADGQREIDADQRQKAALSTRPSTWLTLADWDVKCTWQ